ncbi:MAG: protein kinase [Candidatus Eremiobacterota bacterium]
MIGKILSERYKLLEMISEGGTSEIFLAEDISSGKNVVIKLIKEHLLYGPEKDKFKTIERLRRELKMSEQINHPNIIIAKNIEEFDGKYYIVLDYVPGMALSVLMERETFGIGFIVRLMIELCNILGHAHSTGIVHRDLKPSNIMITEEGRINILDFGYALNMLDSNKLTNEGAILGTASYIAPEQVMDSTVDSRADLYSLGVIMYELLTGKKPFRGSSKITVIMQHVNDPPKSPSIYNPSIPLHIEQITMKLLEKKPDDRYSSAGELMEALKNRSDEMNLPENLSYRGISFLNPRSSLVGRDEEFKELYLEADKLKEEKHIKLIIVSGPQGTGKTRLLEEIEVYARIRNMLFVKGICSREKFFSPYYTIIDGLCPFFSHDRNELYNNMIFKKDLNFKTETNNIPFRNMSGDIQEIKELADKIYPYIIPLMEPYGRRGEPEFTEDVSGLLLNFLIDLSCIKPLIITIDDLHWTDASTFNFLLELQKKHEGHILIIATLDEDKLLGEYEVIPDMTRWNEVFSPKSVSIRNLGPEHTAEMIKSILMTETIEDKLFQKIHIASEGNPLFIKESINFLIESKTLNWQENNWKVDEEKINFLLPNSINELLIDRIKLMDKMTKDFLTKASIFPDNFYSSYLSFLIENDGKEEQVSFSEEKNSFLIEQAIKNKILCKEKRGKEEIYSFTNHIMKEIFYNSIPKEKRQELHLNIAHKLELTYEEWEIPDLVELSYHFFKGKDYSLSNFYLIQAGDKVKSLGLYDSAHRIYSNALQLSERFEMEEDLDVLKRKLKEISNYEMS